MPASPKKQKPPRKQVNIGFDPADYERIQAAAAAEELTPTEFIRDAALASLDPPDDIATPPSVGAMPIWLISLLLFLRSGRSEATANVAPLVEVMGQGSPAAGAGGTGSRPADGG